METQDAPARISAVVLAGGTAERLAGFDKAGVEVAGRTLLERALDALIDIDEVVVVGHDVPTERPVTFTREDPAQGGPAAGLLAGLRAFLRPPDRIVVLAVDMPLVTAHTIRRITSAQHADGAMLVDADGRDQPLCAVYVVESLLRNSPGYGEEHGLAMRKLLEGLDLARVPAEADEAHDVDTFEDLRDIRQQMEL